MIPQLQIAIVGCGTAGLASALFLKELGFQTTLFEQTEKLNPVGAGLLLQPTGLKVLKKLGLEDFILKNGSPVYRLLGRLSSSKVVMDFNYRDLAQGLFGLGVHRGALFEALYQKVLSQNIPVVLNVKQKSYEKRNGKYFLYDQHHQCHGPYDFVIAADGARSELRHFFNQSKKDKIYPWGALWVILNQTSSVHEHTLFQIYEGTKILMGFLPSGIDPADGKRKISLFWSVNHNDHKNFDFEKWRKKALSLSTEMAPLFDQIENPNQMIVATYHDVVMKNWHDGEGLIFIGDAAHATSPQLGQGANLALMDAEALGFALTRAKNLSEALALWVELRKNQIRYYQWASRFMTPFFQSHSCSLGFLRDHLMGPVCKTSFFKHMALSTMAGFKTGIFSEKI